MAKKMNGTAKWILVGIAVASVGAGLVAGFVEHEQQISANCAEIEEHKEHTNADIAELDAENVGQWIDIDSNSQHTDKDSVDTEYIKRDIAVIQKDVAGLKQGMDDFATEQREMNLKILDRLPK